MTHTILRSFLFTLCACACSSAFWESDGSSNQVQEIQRFGSEVSGYAIAG